MALSKKTTITLARLLGPQSNNCPENNNGVCGVMRRTGNAPTFCGTDGNCYIKNDGADMCEGNSSYWNCLDKPVPKKYR